MNRNYSNKIIALIPARAGSKRIPNKNIRLLNGRPLLEWSIRAAFSSIVDEVYVSSDSQSILAIAERAGAKGILRPKEFAGDLSPDIEWVKHALDVIKEVSVFTILRPTSPFRTGATINRAITEFVKQQPCDSLRAVELCKQHPCKMWQVMADKEIVPFYNPTSPVITNHYHSMPYQALPKVYVQNASLEVAWARTVHDTGTIAGHEVVPFFTEGYEGFDLNNEDEWMLAEEIIKRGKVRL